MEVGTTSRWGALMLFAALVCAAFAIDGLQAGAGIVRSRTPAAVQLQPVPRQSETPLLLSRAGLQ